MSDQARGIAYPLYERVTRELALRGLTTVELQARTGVARSTVNKWQHVQQAPQPRTVNRVADYLGIPREEALRLAGVFDDEPPLVPDLIQQGIDRLIRAGDEDAGHGQDARPA